MSPRRFPLVLATAVLGACALPLFVVGLAGAGTNVWTDEFPHPTRWKGHAVTCTASRCTHLSPSLVYRKDGMLYRTAVRVFRRGTGYGLAVSVQISVVDGQPHGLIHHIGLSGSVQSLSMGPRTGWGFGGGLRMSSHVPRIHPGQMRVKKAAYPSNKSQRAIHPGRRFTLTVNVSHVVRYSPRSNDSPKVAIVVLTVPFKGKPTLRYKRLRP